MLDRRTYLTFLRWLISTQNMKVTKGLDHIKTYRDSNTKTGNALLRSFCSDCGSNVFLAPEAGGLAIVQAATVAGSENWGRYSSRIL